jgi:hypothetical protein
VFTWLREGVTAQIHLNWHYRVDFWPNPSDSGTADIDVSSSTVNPYPPLASHGVATV